MVRLNAIESLYTGKCNIYHDDWITDVDTNVTSKKRVCIAKDKPCRLSYKIVDGTVGNENADTTRQIIKLFLRNDIEIPAGCYFEVTQHNVTRYYSNSSVPNIHSLHQEVILKYADKYGRI